MGEYGTRPVDTAPAPPTKDDEPAQLTAENAWERPTPNDTKLDSNPPPSRASNYDNRPPNGTPATDARLPPSEDHRVHDRDRDRTDLERVGLITGDTAGRQSDTAPIPANTVPAQGTGLHQPVPPAV